VHTPDAETLGDLKVDTLVVDLKGLAEMGEASEEDLEQAEKVIGKSCASALAPRPTASTSLSHSAAGSSAIRRSATR